MRLKYVVETLRPVERSSLHVRSKNEAGVRLYQGNLGFLVDKTEATYVNMPHTPL
jgi:ribosomal protein S18 acetylase RimI-like enzyme